MTSAVMADQKLTYPSCAPWLFGIWLGMLLLTHTPFSFSSDLLNGCFFGTMCFLPILMLSEITQGASKVMTKVQKCLGCLILLFVVCAISFFIRWFADPVLFETSVTYPRIAIDSANSIVCRDRIPNLFNNSKPYKVEITQIKQVFPGIEHRYLIATIKCSGVDILSAKDGIVQFRTHEPLGEQEVSLVK